MVDYGVLHNLTEGLLKLKQRFFPGLAPAGASHLSWMLREIKGNEVRKEICEGGRNLRRQRMGYLKEVLALCERNGARLTGRVWVKGIGEGMDGTATYTFSLQSIYSDFQNYLTKHNDVGMVIADSRLKHLNTPVAHSIFTQKFKGAGDAYDRIVELPAFSHSDNHAGLQLIDTICSAVMMPIAIHTYCVGHVQSVHVRPGYQRIKDTFADKCRQLQHRYREATGGPTKGGFIVSDHIAQRPGGLMFR